MVLLSTLLSLLLPPTLVSGNLHYLDGSRKGEPEKWEKVGFEFWTRDRRQQRSATSEANHESQEGNPCAPSIVKVLDFSADIDQQPDINGEFTSATLNAGFLPESFTICTAFMVQAWKTGFSSADMFTMLADGGYKWGRIRMFASSNFTRYKQDLARWR